ncbi:hypothetical protein [Clostridium sp.]|uniref:hypothetical protein n=1 Tax=Clostridium sp. TaxID=1506 RepID=UPI002FC70784
MGVFHTYVDAQLTSLTQSSPLIAFAKPLISRVIDNNAYKVEDMLKQVSDKNGMVDIDGILSEMVESVINTKPFKINTKFIGDIEIGGGKIKINLPLVDKALVFNHQDLIKLKDTLNYKSIDE